MHRLEDRSWKIEVGVGFVLPYSIFHIPYSCVDNVYYLLKAVGKAVGKSRSCAQVVFATQSLGTTGRFVRNLCELPAQACAQVFYTFNSASLLVFPLMHSTNNNYYKGE